MRVVVTGGAGFLGSHLCERLLADGHEVVCVDNFITGRSEHVDMLAGSSSRFSFQHADVSSGVFVDGVVDAVLHFASPASPVDYLMHPIPTLKVGALGTHNTLGLAKAKGARYLLASTSEVYGDPQVHPQPETYWGHVNPIGPRGVYDEAKRYAEAMTMAYHRTHGLDTRIVRIFNTYGPRMRPADGRAIPEFISAALDGAAIPVHGDGSQTRSFCYVTDEIQGFIRLLASSQHDPVNIGNPIEMTVLEMAQLIIKLTGSSSSIEFLPRPVDDPNVRRPDITRARTLLGWEPQVAPEEGIARTIEWFRTQRG
ncbi:MAG: UDP-glucuronic acid decarboxylase family protein [Actinomycetota bacterium]|nr:SDR family oxidoreductase [Actinomycetota bacterium]